MTLTSDYSDVVQARSEFTCECGSQFVKLANGTFVCAKTVERTFTPLELARYLGGWYDRKDLSLAKREETVAFILTNWERLRHSDETSEQPEKPVAWYRWGGSALVPILAWGNWPPPEPDDVAWYPLYATPDGRPALKASEKQS